MTLGRMEGPNASPHKSRAAASVAELRQHLRISSGGSSAVALQQHDEEEEIRRSKSVLLGTGVGMFRWIAPVIAFFFFCYIMWERDDLVPFAVNAGIEKIGGARGETVQSAAASGEQGSSEKVSVWHGEKAEEPQGWHPEWRKSDFKVRLGAEFAESRTENRPFRIPSYEDPGERYIPFPESELEAEWADKPRLVYDTNVIRLTDDFGLIDDGYTADDLEDIFTRVVAIYARMNVYVRVPLEDLANTHALSRAKSLQYLAYVEGPDYGEFTNLRENKNSLNLGAANVRYNNWYYEEWRKVIPTKVPLLERFVRSFRSLKKPFWVKQKSDYMRNLLDWVIGFPHLQTPWQISHTTPMFPMFSLHIMNGECRAGRITGRTGSCWEKPLKAIVDKANGGLFVKNMTCRRYLHQLSTRYKLKKGETFVRDTEKRTMFGAGAARMWAHEIGHSLTLHHPKGECLEPLKWEDNNLMMQQRYVGLKGEGCPETPIEEQARGTAWDHKQIKTVREYVSRRDVKQSATVPNGITVGDSTEQLGARSVPVFRRFLLNRANFIGNGKNIRRRPCGRPQSLIVFYALPSPADGRVHRVRWMPATHRDDSFRVRVSVVAPLEDFDNERVVQRFEVVQRSSLIQVPRYHQKMHIELDLVEPLLISKGQMVMLATEDGKSLDIDQQLYESDKVLYGDISGKLPQAGPSFHNEILQSKYSEVKLSYPALRINRRQRQWFYSSKNTNKVNLFDLDDRETGALQFSAEAPAKSDKDSHCLPLIFNYDLIPEL